VPLALLDAVGRAGSADLLWHDPASWPVSHWLPAVQGFWYEKLSRAGARRLRAEAIEGRIRRPVVRGAQRVRDLNAFLGTERVSIGEGALCEVTTPLSANVSVFAPVRFGARLYHVLMRGIDELPAAADELAAVNFVIGSCLFSDRALRIICTDGALFDCLTTTAPPISAPVTRIESSPSLTLYEREGARRLPWLTAAMISALPPAVPVTVTLDVPRVQYHLYLLEGFHRGLVSEALMSSWVALVDERNRRVTELLGRELRTALSQVQRGRRVPIRFAASMRCLEAAIGDSVRAGAPLALGRMAEILRADDPIWAAALRRSSPTSYRDLVNLSYAVELVRGGLARYGRRHRLSVAVDNPIEQPAYAHAQAIAAEITDATRRFSFSLLGLYPLERAFTTDITGRTDLYAHDPGQRFVDQAGRPYGLADLIARLYPSRRRPVWLGEPAVSPSRPARRPPRPREVSDL
jgi:hypothetical protein